MSVTLRDIAERAKVTEQAVSRALRGHSNISLPTIRKVRKIANDLGYRPNLAARNLRSRGAKTVGFVFPDITFSYAQDIVEGARGVFEKFDYMGLVGLASWNAEREAKEVELLLGYQVQALICQPMVDSHAVYEKVVKTGTPIIFVANGLNVPGTGWVGLDGYDAGTKMMEHLLALGHRRIAFIGPDSTDKSLALRPILLAYNDALRQAGIPLDETLRFHSELGSGQSVRDIADQLLAIPSPPTAIFAVSDAIAYEVMGRLMQRGVRIPDEMSIAGIGGAAPSAMEMISLTTVMEDARQIGTMAAQSVLDLLQDPDRPPARTQIQCPLIHRRSTGVPRQNAELRDVSGRS